MILLVVWSALVVTIFVAPDGSGDVPTLQAAVDLADDGDVIQLGAGVFAGAGNRDIDISNLDVTIEPVDGPGTTTLDPDGSPATPHRAFRVSGSGTVVLRDLTFRDGWADVGGAILVEGGAAPVIKRCRFVNNDAGEWGGAVCARDGDPLIEGGTFISNTAAVGGAVFYDGLHSLSSDPGLIANVIFVGNQATADGGGLFVDGWTHVDIVGCVFVANEAPEGGGFYGDARIEQCTLTANRATVGGGIYCRNSFGPGLPMERTILWGNCAPSGRELWLRGCQPTIVCSIVDSSGVESDFILIEPEYVQLIDVDPRFCQPVGCTGSPGAEVDVTVSDTSPALAAHNECGLPIGAAQAACVIVPVEHVSVGLLKQRYR